eukprot:gene7787-23364_t
MRAPASTAARVGAAAFVDGEAVVDLAAFRALASRQSRGPGGFPGASRRLLRGFSATLPKLAGAFGGARADKKEAQPTEAEAAAMSASAGNVVLAAGMSTETPAAARAADRPRDLSRSLPCRSPAFCRSAAAMGRAPPPSAVVEAEAALGEETRGDPTYRRPRAGRVSRCAFLHAGHPLHRLWRWHLAEAVLAAGAGGAAQTAPPPGP